MYKYIALNDSARHHPGREPLWEYSVPAGLVVFDFQMGRGRAGPKHFLEGFRGTLQSDGYGAYADLGPDIIYAGCLAHARRGFVDAAKVAPLDPLPPEVVQHFGQIYAVEDEARHAGLAAAGRLAPFNPRPNSTSVPLFRAFRVFRG